MLQQLGSFCECISSLHNWKLLFPADHSYSARLGLDAVLRF